MTITENKKVSTGPDVKLVLTIAMAVSVGLFSALYVSFSSSQRDETHRLDEALRQLLTSVNEAGNDTRVLRARIDLQERLIADLEEQVFVLQCDLAKGRYDFNEKTCTTAGLTRRFLAQTK